MRSSPPPSQPARPEKKDSQSTGRTAPQSVPSSSTSPRPKESSFLKSIGLELSAFGFGGSAASKKTPAASKTGPPVATQERRSHRPAPKAPAKQSDVFPGVKLRSRETLLPDKESEQELSDRDFDDLAVLLEAGSDAPEDRPRKVDEEEEEVVVSELSKMSSDDLEKNLMRMSLSEFAPTEDAPAPPPVKKKKDVTQSVAPENAEILVLEETKAKPEISVGTSATTSSSLSLSSSIDPVIVTVEVPVRDEKVEKELISAKEQLMASSAREAELEVRLSEVERAARQIEAEGKQRIQELEMQLDALVREKESHSSTAPAEPGPTREELMAAMDAYRGKLAETSEELQKSEERKTQLRDDLRKLIAKSKEIESNAKQWKQRCESFETKFAKTKDLAREYAERWKALEKEKKERVAISAPTDGDGEDVKAQIVALTGRAKKAEEMAKLAVGVIKKSGTPELRKELATALQALQASKAATVEAKSDRRKSPREPQAKVEVEEQKTERSASMPTSVSPPPVIKSPRVEGLGGGSSSTSFLSPQVGRKQKTPEVALASAGGSKTPMIERKQDASLSASPPPKRSEVEDAKSVPSQSVPPIIKSPRLEVVGSGSSSFLSPQVERKNKFVAVASSSAGGSKTPTIARRKDPEPVMGSPSVQRRNNPGRSEKVPAPSPVTPKISAEQKPKVAVETSSQDNDAFALLEGMLLEVEKETGQTGLSGPVDNSHLFGESSQGDASSYLESMKQEASAEQMAIEKEMVRIKHVFFFFFFFFDTSKCKRLGKLRKTRSQSGICNWLRVLLLAKRTECCCRGIWRKRPITLRRSLKIRFILLILCFRCSTEPKKCKQMRRETRFWTRRSMLTLWEANWC
jgi:hypothetical protein